MKTITPYVLIITILILLVYANCVPRKCIKDVKVTDTYFYHMNNPRKYCKSYRSALEKDSTAFKYLVDLNFYDGATYEHGFVLSFVVDSIGEELVNRWIRNQYIDGDKLKTYLRAGQDWRNGGKYENRESVLDRYPLIFE